nr:paxillin-B isoform X1 [Leptinotarsa decemlineata]
MGLILSILVACMGACELIALCANVRRNITSSPVRGDLSTISDRYVKELKGSGSNTVPNSQTTLNEFIKTASNSTRLNSHEDVEMEYKKSKQKCRSPSPRKFLITEKEIDSERSSPSSRHFVVSDDMSPFVRSPAHTSIQEYSIKEVKNSIESPDKPRYVLQEEENSETSIIPLPKQFILTENTAIVLNCQRERSLSPLPPVDLPQVPRNSFCNDLLNTGEVHLDKNISRSPTPGEKVDVILESSSFNTTQYWTNKVLVVPSNRSKSRSPSPIAQKASVSASGKTFLRAPKQPRARSKSENIDHNFESPLDREKKAVSNLGLSDDFEWSFPLEDNKECPPYESFSGYAGKVSNAQSIQKMVNVTSHMRKVTNETENAIAKVRNSFNSENTTAVLTHAAEELKKVSSKENFQSEHGTTSGPKPGEPFWLIFSGEYTKAMNKDWHGQHFCCWQCDESLTGQRYVLRDEHPYCVSCYESVFSNACEKCSRTIGIDSKDLSYKDKHWHEACFLCTTCGESLVDKQFGSKGDRIYCGSCYDQQFASRCDGCHEIFRAGTKKMEYKTRQWHEKCFCCCVCKVPIGTQSFIPREQEIYCSKCYEEKFATRCIKCNKVITSGGVTYKNEPWHRECFTCTHCTKSLAGERFTSRDEKAYCAECFGELFAKRCTACTKPITGIGGTKFISFEDRHWHNDCFFCASCRTSLVGRGFITDQDDIICPECAKQKLM